ncbi:hypothetical protein HJC23_005697 [Cyclotella cryptica]|uniref:Uncharacterized protein n=1 Tax=Cyclotella cryptica TaxID=29204 RepID=A0ABD3P522_9STRA|eukprot:CCRYP_017756-RA/>CCRYP_017756-RA protein AED:0.28 eAED:0.28 QI:0/-1/0/1/-1/1/1/0/470
MTWDYRSATSWLLPWITLPLVLTISALPPCFSFILHPHIDVTIIPKKSPAAKNYAVPHHICPPTSTSVASTNGDDLGSRKIEADHDDYYLDFDNAKDAVTTPASKFSSDFERNIKSAAVAATCGLSNATTRATALPKDFGNNIKSAASATPSRPSSVAKNGGADALSFASKAIMNAKKIVESSTGSIREKSVLSMDLDTTKSGDVFGFAEKGIFEIQSLSRNGTERLGEVSKWINEQTKSGTEIVSSKAKSLVLQFTGKDEYSFGDITHELIRRIATKEIAVQDTILVIKILVALGASIGPLAKALPLTILLEALNLSLEQKVGAQVLDALALSIDNRIIAAFTQDDKVQIGDAVKRTVLTGVLAFTGKSKYESGDIRRVVQENEEDETTKPARLDLVVDPELQEWDRLFIECCLQNIEQDQNLSSSAAKVLDMKISLALEECAKLDEYKANNLGKGAVGARDKYFDKLN